MASAATLATIAQLDATDHTEPGRPSTADMALLDELPYLALNLAHAPEPLLRTLFEITQLSARLHDDSEHVTITIRLPADQLPDIATPRKGSPKPRSLNKKRLPRRQAILMQMLYVPPVRLERTLDGF